MSSLTFIKRLMGFMLMGVLMLSSTAALSESEFITSGSKAASLKSCIAPTAEMRSHHMVNLKHDRFDNVRNGNRSTKYSLAECVNCHAGTDAAGTPLPVNAEGQFCSSCHEKVAVSMPCFDCHRKIPEAK